MPSRFHIAQGRLSPTPRQQSSRHYFPNPIQEAHCQLPTPPLCPGTHHPPVLPLAPARAQPAPRAGKKSATPSADSPWQLVGHMPDSPASQAVPQSPPWGSALEHALFQLPSLPRLMTPPLHQDFWNPLPNKLQAHKSSPHFRAGF